MRAVSKLLIIFDTPLSLQDYEDMNTIVELRTITYKKTLLFTICMIKSFYKASKISARCYIHIDNKLPWLDRALLRYHLPFAKLVEYINNPITNNSDINNFQHSFQGQKLMTCFNDCKASKLLLIDSDILFFERPSALLDWAKQGKACLFMEDTGSYVMLSRGEFNHYFGIDRVKVNINTGILGLIKTQPLFNKSDLSHFVKSTTSIINDRRIPNYEAHYWKDNYILIEQSAYIYFLSRAINSDPKFSFSVLSKDKYQLVARTKFSDNPVAIHYAGESKDLMYEHYFYQRIKSLLKKI